jgi:putative intracellular protease/amidase
MNASILIVVTSHTALGDTGKPTGFWLEELAVPYLVFTRAGARVDIASPKGGRAPADPRSLDAPSADVKAFQEDVAAQQKLEHTLQLSAVKQQYDAVFIAGGHGVMWDLTRDGDLKKLLESSWARGAVVAAVCHGPAVLAQLKTPSGAPLVQGLRFTGFSDEEETAMELTKVVPFLIESTLKGQGGRYERAPMWQAHVVRDGHLVTGQNPASSKGTAEETLAALKRSGDGR